MAGVWRMSGVRRTGRWTGVGVVIGALVGCTVSPTDTAAPPPASSQPVVPASFTIAATGDVLIHPALTEQALRDGNGVRDFSHQLAGVRAAISNADLAVCHLEVPIAAPSGPFTGYPDFNAPPEIVPALADLGYDSCTTASNHTLDQGPEGVRRTLDALDRAGVRHTGSARTAREAATPLIYDVRGVKVGHVSHTYGFNGRRPPADQPWLGNQISPDEVLAAARRARDAGAELVLASLHWGVEHATDASPDQRELARTLLNDPAIDLIIGHHAHAVQPFEKINDKWVTYGLGNMIARHERPRGTTEEGAIARFTVERSGTSWRVVRAEYLPILVELGPPIRLVDLTTQPSNPRRAEAITRTERIVNSRGARDHGLTRP